MLECWQDVWDIWDGMLSRCPTGCTARTWILDYKTIKWKPSSSIWFKQDIDWRSQECPVKQSQVGLGSVEWCYTEGIQAMGLWLLCIDSTRPCGEFDIHNAVNYKLPNAVWSAEITNHQKGMLAKKQSQASHDFFVHREKNVFTN